MEQVKLSLDLRVQHVLRDELAAADGTATRRSAAAAVGAQ